MEKNNMNWYVIKVQNNREQKVLQKIIEQLESDGLSHVIGGSIVPVEKHVTMKNGKKQFKDKVVYPGYIFLETNAIGEINNVIRQTDGAGGFVKQRDGSIIPMRTREVEKLYKDQQKEDDIDITKLFVSGEEVKVIDGAFASFKGSIKEINADKQRLKVEIAIFNRMTDIDLDFAQVEKLS